MKQYVIDEIRPSDHEKLKAYLDDALGRVAMGGLYWMPLDGDLLSDVQRSHPDCAPFYLALELGEDRLTGEFLVRTHQRVRCGCIGYADARQRDWLIGRMDAIFETLGIIT